MNIPAWGLIPFVVMLVCIAVLPLGPATSHHWEKNSVKLTVALALGIPVAIWIWLSFDPHLVTHSLIEYAQFITLLLSLYVVSGGLFLQGDIRATPRNNTVMIGLGGLLASFIGTTGAAMLLIRPLLNTNKEREFKVHTVIFTILVVANNGGLLTPLGDPPLYIGLLRGVPFLWTFSLFPQWLFVNCLLLLTYYALDHRMYTQESTFAKAWDEQSRTPLKVLGTLNVVWFLAIIGSVALIDNVWIKIAIQLAAAAASYFLSSREIRFDLNEYTWTPILEVAFLFIGIFLTMIPALAFLSEHARELPLNEITFFIFAGSLSAVLDNAPTYLTFFEMGTQLDVPGMAKVAGVPELFLTAISLGAVTCGAITYIGNGPNFMVKSVAEERGVAMPSFAGYVGWTFRYLVPILAAMVCAFIAQDTIVNIAGWALGAILAGRAILIIRQHSAAESLAADDGAMQG